MVLAPFFGVPVRPTLSPRVPRSYDAWYGVFPVGHAGQAPCTARLMHPQRDQHRHDGVHTHIITDAHPWTHGRPPAHVTYATATLRTGGLTRSTEQFLYHHAPRPSLFGRMRRGREGGEERARRILATGHGDQERCSHFESIARGRAWPQGLPCRPGSQGLRGVSSIRTDFHAKG